MSKVCLIYSIGIMILADPLFIYRLNPKSVFVSLHSQIFSNLQKCNFHWFIEMTSSFMKYQSYFFVHTDYFK